MTYLPLQEVHSASALVLCILVLLGAEELGAAGWHGLRELLVIALKLAAATAPLFRMHATYTLGVRRLHVQFWAAQVPSVNHAAACPWRLCCLLHAHGSSLF